MQCEAFEGNLTSDIKEQEFITHNYFQENQTYKPSSYSNYFDKEGQFVETMPTEEIKTMKLVINRDHDAY